jgi:hypothetical protein
LDWSLRLWRAANLQRSAYGAAETLLYCPTQSTKGEREWPLISPICILRSTTTQGLFVVLGVAGFIATALLILHGDQYFQNNIHKRLSQLALSVWSVGPPEYGNKKAGFAGLKAAQDITAKVWAAIANLLAVFYAITFPK